MQVFLCFILGLSAGFVLGVMESNVGAGLAACELELPRNQHCVLIAVPEKSIP